MNINRLRKYMKLSFLLTVYRTFKSHKKSIEDLQTIVDIHNTSLEDLLKIVKNSNETIESLQGIINTQQKMINQLLITKDVSEGGIWNHVHDIEDRLDKLEKSVTIERHRHASIGLLRNRY